MPFFKQKQSFEVKASQFLWDALKRKGKLNRLSNLKKWSQEFHELHSSVGIPHQSIRQVLKWYCNHIGNGHVPTCYSARSFCLRFYDIQKVMQKDSDEKIARQVKIPKQAFIIAKQLAETMPWPKGSGSQLGSAVAISLDNFQEFKQQMRILQEWIIDRTRIRDETNKQKQKLKDLLEFIIWLEGFYDDPRENLLAWFVAVNNRVVDNPQWSGNLIPQRWHTGSKWFHAQGYDYGIRYAGKYGGKYWDALMRLMNI